MKSDCIRKGSYHIKPLDLSPQELEQVSDLFIRSGSTINGGREFLDWQYNLNPAGQAVGYNAYFDGLLIAHYAAIPLRAKVFGEDVFGYLSINTRTDREHQGQGLFTRLAESTYSDIEKTGGEFVVGVANENSVYGFTKKLGFQHVGVLDRRFVLGSPSMGNCDLDYEPIWDSATVAWRLDNPTKSYKYRIKGDRALLYGKSRQFLSLIGDVPYQSLPPGLETISRFSLMPKLWLGIAERMSWGGTLYALVPRMLHPVQLNLIYRDLKGARSLDPASVLFLAMDFDAY
jgi:GNAT superfamily N-acetyltransferase